MGVLDDAIREHLELKRRHGAAEDDLRRQEEEALGPARRDAAAADEATAGAEISEEEHAEISDERHLSGEQIAPPGESVVDEGAFEATAAVELHEDEVPAHAEDAGATELHEPELFVDDEPDDAPLEPKADHPPLEPDEEHDLRGHAPSGVSDTPAHGFEELDDDELLDEEDLPEDEDAEPGEDPDDVLEDTPDFLQETPEHDRLWFEQKPPRDFDFD
jgi:hypothetical protein